MLRVLVADDSPTARQLLEEILSRDPELSVVGTACNGDEAVRLVKRLRPDVVTMDLEMPKLNGFEAIEEIMVSMPTPIIVLVSSTLYRDVNQAMRALRAGALTVLKRPIGPPSSDFERSARELVETVKSMAQVKVVRRYRPRVLAAPPPPACPLPPSETARPRVVAISASTGGPPALQQLFCGLPSSFPLPILVVQHISAGFTGGLVSWLDSTVPLRVTLPAAGERLARGTVYVAPEERHLGVSRQGTVLLSGQAPIANFRPSATFLYQSAAQAYGASTVAVILTGMGSDGLAGLHAVRQAGGLIIAQDEATSAVFGMPRAVIEAGLADLVLPLEQISQELLAQVQATLPDPN